MRILEYTEEIYLGKRGRTLECNKYTYRIANKIHEVSLNVLDLHE